MGKKHKSKNKGEEATKSDIPAALSNKKILNNVRIYKREGPIVEEHQTSAFTRYLPQFVANIAINLIMADTGLALSYPTLVIGYINAASARQTHNGTSENHYGFLPPHVFPNITFTDLQSSIYSSVQYLAVPVGCVVGGYLVDRLGRRRLMLLCSCPMLLFWLLNFLSQNQAMLYLANICSGLGIGLSESGIATYQGEVSEARVRGTLVNLSILVLALSLLGPYLLHLLLPSWRLISLLLAAVPVCAGVVALLVPESPVWLLSKGQVTIAEKSLMRLRGGATKKEISDEMQQIISYHHSTNILHHGHPATTTQPHTHLQQPGERRGWMMRWWSEEGRETWRYVMMERVRRPLVLSCTLFLLVYTTGTSTLRPYLSPLLHSIHYTGHWTTIALSLTLSGVVGNVLAVFAVGYTGKRLLALSGLVLNGAAGLLVGVALLERLSVTVSLVSLHVMFFVSGYGIVPVPWLLQTEIYPFRGRGMLSGVAAGLSYIIGFVTSLMFLPLAGLITMEAMFIIFSLISLVGAVYVYLNMPETEGRTLQQIEAFFSSNKVTGL